MQHADRLGRLVAFELDFPYTLSAVSAVLFQNPRSGGSQCFWKIMPECLDCPIEACIGAPAELSRVVENLLGSDSENHVGMRADEDPSCGNFPKQRVKLLACLAV